MHIQQRWPRQYFRPPIAVTHSWREVQLMILTTMHLYSSPGIIMCQNNALLSA